MKKEHILLQFAEIPEQENIDMSIIEYDHELNLSVVKGTKIPAVLFTDLATETFTKTNGEAADSDRNLNCKMSNLLSTSTQTRVSNEAADSDPRHTFTDLCDTATYTLVNSEVSDSDKNFRDLSFLSATRTLTESSETLDTDQ